MHSQKALVIGGGIGGLTTAIALTRVGIDVEVYEQASQPRADGAGLTLWANAIRALNALDAAGTITSSVNDDTANAIRRWNGDVLSAIDAQILRQKYGASTVAVHRVDFMHALLAKTGDCVRFGKRLARYEQDADGIHVTFDDGTQASGDMLIGADGIHSRVRSQMFPASQPVYRGYASWRGVVHFDHRRINGMWGETWGQGARFGIVPLSEGRVYWFAPLNRPANSPPAHHRALLLKTFGNWHDPIPALLNETPDEALLYNDISDIEPLPGWIDGRAVLLGDAAHAMTPNMGQGACQAIEDAAALGSALERHSTYQEAFAAYERARLSHTRRVVMQSRRIGQLGQLENPLLAWVRDTFTRLLPSNLAVSQLGFVLGEQ